MLLTICILSANTICVEPLEMSNMSSPGELFSPAICVNYVHVRLKKNDFRTKKDFNKRQVDFFMSLIWNSYNSVTMFRTFACLFEVITIFFDKKKSEIYP